MVLKEDLTLEQKLQILGDAAKYDVACTSSGSDRSGEGFSMGNAISAGICHSFTQDGRCISLLKILMTNECIYQCKYCVNRASNDTLRATFTPEEVAKLTMEFYKRNYIEGLFLSSGIYPTPQASAERMLEAVRLLRQTYRFGGYIHVKSIPGADADTLYELGWLADRMSVNLELPTAEGLKELAPNKTRKNILTPMRMIQNGIREDGGEHARGLQAGNRKRLAAVNAAADEERFLENAHRQGLLQGIREDPVTSRKQVTMQGARSGESFLPVKNSSKGEIIKPDTSLLHTNGSGLMRPRGSMKHFVPAGQSTQMIIGATPESDLQILSVTESLYQKFELKRVFYSSFINVNQDPDMPEWQGRTLLDREHRLYQADFLLRFYHFQVEELLSPERPNFNMLVDPKCDYALRHLELFPVEINRASYDMLLKVPGIGVKSALRILKARQTCVLDFADLKKIGVVMKRAVYFITCRGRMLYPIRMTEDNLTSYLIDDDKRKALQGDRIEYKQLSLFDLSNDFRKAAAI